MDTRPIGVLDSGLGGLTAVREVLSALPEENMVYFGDTGRVPYGSRSSVILEKYTRQDLRFLEGKGIKALLVACGTISSNSLDAVRGDFPFPMTGVVEPAIRAAARATKNQKIGIIATAATIRSGAYQRTLQEVMPEAEAMALACPLFVPLVESGHFAPGDRMAEAAAEEYLSPLRTAGVDTLVLGCTHYPILSEVIGRYMGPKVALIDSGRESVLAFRQMLEQRDLRAPGDNRAELHFYVSDLPEGFSRWGGMVLSRDIPPSEISQIEIEDY